MPKLRLALTISGAVALGAYEGGALAALLRAVGPLCGGRDPEVRIDAIGGASAGSMTGFLAARCLTEGIDPNYVMREAWVHRDSVQRMLVGLQDSPLSIEAMRGIAGDLLEPGEHLVDGHQDVPVHLAMVLACLRGLNYDIKSLVSATAIAATTHVDVFTTEVRHGQKTAEFIEPVDGMPALVDVALASGSNAVGFPPKILDRTADLDTYRERGLRDLPENSPPLNLWYTDGGTLDNEPLGHTLDLVGRLDAQGGSDDFRRLQLLIHPHPTGAAAGSAWADRNNAPTWVATLLRADNMQRTQTLYEDLRRLEKTNSRIEWADRLVTNVAPHLERLPDDVRRQVETALRETLESIADDRAAFATHSVQPTGSAPETTAEGDSVGDLLRRAVAQAAGVSGKHRIAVEVISPLLLEAAKTTPIEKMLAGELMGHFGGFFDKHLRASDFDLGYQSVLTWLSPEGVNGLARNGLDDSRAEEAFEAAAGAYDPKGRDAWRKWGGTSLAGVAVRHPLTMAGLLGQFVRVLAQDAFRHRSHRQR